MKGFKLKRKSLALITLLSLGNMALYSQAIQNQTEIFNQEFPECHSEQECLETAVLAVRSIGELINLFVHRLETFIDLKRKNGDSCQKHVEAFTTALTDFKTERLDQLNAYLKSNNTPVCEIAITSCDLLNDFFIKIEQVCNIIKKHQHSKNGKALGADLEPCLRDLGSDEKFKEITNALDKIRTLVSTAQITDDFEAAYVIINNARTIQQTILKTSALTLYNCLARRLRC